MKIGIIGHGILGQAVESALKDTWDLEIIDPPKGHYGSIESCDSFILCLPTPPAEDGSCNTELVEYYVKQLSLTNKPILLKSTVNPQVLEDLNYKFDFTYSPEFLREASNIDDFKKQEFAIFSGHDPVSWHKVFDDAGVVMKKVSFVDMQTASYVKYIINTFLATKVIFFNEISELFDGDFDELIDNVSLDKRIGSSHMNVPGPDGKKGFGGMCFPKDTKAFVDYAKKKGKPLKLLEEVIKLNEDIR